MKRALRRELAARDGVRLLGSLGFENAYALAMRRDLAARLGIATIADLARVAPRLRLASDIEFLNRPEWRSVAGAYRLRFAATRSYAPTFMYRAVADDSADVLSAFSSDGRIAAFDLVTLGDPRRALPNYDAVILLSPHAGGDAKLAATLRPLVGAIPLERIRQANLMVDRDIEKRTPRDAAEWLSRNLRGR